MARCCSYLYLFRAFLPASLFTLRSSLFSSAALDVSPQLRLKVGATDRVSQEDVSRFPTLETGAHSLSAQIKAAGARGTGAWPPAQTQGDEGGRAYLSTTR